MNSVTVRSEKNDSNCLEFGTLSQHQGCSEPLVSKPDFHAQSSPRTPPKHVGSDACLSSDWKLAVVSDAARTHRRQTVSKLRQILKYPRIGSSLCSSPAFCRASACTHMADHQVKKIEHLRMSASTVGVGMEFWSRSPLRI